MKLFTSGNSIGTIGTPKKVLDKSVINQLYLYLLLKEFDGQLIALFSLRCMASILLIFAALLFLLRKSLLEPVSDNKSPLE